MKPSTAEPFILPFVITLIGLALLLDRFLFFPNINLLSLTPLLLVMIGGVLLFQGDFVPDNATRAFGITRGSVQSATLELNSGEVDVVVGTLDRTDRLIAGQYARSARPLLHVDEARAHTYLRMDRATTYWSNTASWEIGLATDLPWQPVISTNMGNVALNLHGVIVDGGVVASGIGDIQLVCPSETLRPLTLISQMGKIHVTCPIGSAVEVSIQGTGFSRVRVDQQGYEQVHAKQYRTVDAVADAPVVQLIVKTTFSDVYLTRAS
ncbi:MAG: hypothetical protein ACOYLB_03360 [Phototrophicaceae bacterium]